MKTIYVKSKKSNKNEKIDIEKIDTEAKYVVPMDKTGENIVINEKKLKKVGGYVKGAGQCYFSVNEQLLDKINELVDAVNELNRIYDNE